MLFIIKYDDDKREKKIIIKQQCIVCGSAQQEQFFVMVSLQFYYFYFWCASVFNALSVANNQNAYKLLYDLRQCNFNCVCFHAKKRIIKICEFMMT